MDARIKEIQDRYNYCHNTYQPKLEIIGKVVNDDLPYLLEQLQKATDRERVLREALEEISLDQRNYFSHCKAIADRALEASK